MFGGLSVAWFVLLFLGRYDHYGRVCSGHYLSDDEYKKYEDGEGAFGKVTWAGKFMSTYVLYIAWSAVATFVIVLLYTLTTDARDDIEEPKIKKEGSRVD